MRFTVLFLAVFVFSVSAFAAPPTTTEQPPQTVDIAKPNMATDALLLWAANAASDVMTFRYDDVQHRLQQSSKWFTKEGWERFAAALQRSRIIDTITARNQTVSAQPNGKAYVFDSGVKDGRYRWTVYVPLTLEYKGSNGGRQDSLQVRLVIERVTTPANSYGIGIADWVVQ